MTTTVAVLLEATFATPAGVSYTSDQCVSQLDRPTATNESLAAATVTALLLSPDGAAMQTYKKTIQPGAAWPFPEFAGHTLDSGGKATFSCPTASAIKVRISGRKFT